MLSETAIHLKQKGLLCGLKGEHANVTPLTQEAPLMRLSVASLRRMVKRPLHVEFVHQQLTSYSGLELLGRYLRQCALPSRLRAACAATGGDYGGGRGAPPRVGAALLRPPPPGQPPPLRPAPPLPPLLWFGPPRPPPPPG